MIRTSLFYRFCRVLVSGPDHLPERPSSMFVCALNSGIEGCKNKDTTADLLALQTIISLCLKSIARGKHIMCVCLERQAKKLGG